MNTYKKLVAFVNANYKLWQNELTGEVFFAIRRDKTPDKIQRLDKLWHKCKLRGLSQKKPDFYLALSDLSIQKFNPIKRYFSVKSPPHQNPFIKLASYVKLASPHPIEFAAALEKHFIRAVNCLYNNVPNKQIFTLVSSQQNIGKTTFINWLTPAELSPYAMATLEGRREKLDTILSSKFLVNLDEFYQVEKDKNAKLKAMCSQPTASVFLPLKNKVVTKPRVTTFFATKNVGKGGWLTDESGSSRYIIYNVEAIDFAYEKKVNVDDLWAWAHKQVLSGESGQLFVEEVRLNEQANLCFYVPEKMQERIKPKVRANAKQSNLVQTLLYALATLATTILAIAYKIVR